LKDLGMPSSKPQFYFITSDIDEKYAEGEIGIYTGFKKRTTTKPMSMVYLMAPLPDNFLKYIL